MASKRKKTRKKRKKVRRLSDDGRMWLSFGVQELATDKEFRSVVARRLLSFGRWPFKKSTRRFEPIHDYRKRHQTVLATIEIDAYLTKLVPERLRKRTYKIRSEGEALIRAADMYLKIFRENEKQGGEPALPTDADIRKRLAKRRRAMRAKPRKRGKSRKRFGVLVNRGFDPYIWGHDLSDLVFEQIFVEWTGPKSCRITFGIGS